MNTRRTFLALAGTSVATGLLNLRCGGGGASPATGPVPAGNVSAVPVGYLQFVPGQPVVLGRDAGGLYAMTSICPHQDCDMTTDGSISSEGVYCSCHGSRFDTEGVVIQGPANSPLVHYQVDLASDGSITVQAGRIVGAGARTSVTS